MAAVEKQRPKEIRQGEMYFKKFDLVTPKYALEHGLTISKPALISKEPYSSVPLVYRVGEVTRATNLNRRQGGIRYDVGRAQHVEELREYEGTDGSQHSGFTGDFKLHGLVALVEPVGTTFNTPRDEYYPWHRRGEAIKVNEVMAFCSGCRLGPLEEGLLLNWGQDYLKPICSIDNHPDDFREPSAERVKQGYHQLPLPQLKFTINPETGFTIAETQIELGADTLSPKERLVVSDSEPKGVWELVEKAREMFAPEAARPVAPLAISQACVTLVRQSGYPVELSLSTYSNEGKQIGEIGGYPDSLAPIINFGISASPGEKTTLKGARFPVHNLYYFLLKTDTTLVIQPAEMYYDYQAKDWKAKTPYPVVLHQDELPQLARFVDPQNFQSS
ncbi:hypothetical protein A3C26_01235 [Candidatus Daviesbacteria bacterium RIFCSPHIGHO2_02_FULL_39_12]|uniref:Uncharacterized protein n=2 Tax=Candidatus Daviesiibacteriota TaxID=1752718 RepID=A0A1F5JBQ1_9BACT|nr:MAG: hypothetical protein A3C26_01235 [Candidatus Daviesbacteria bacterium RIFCSPHIGHO2_02_FULL_39_12]OGE72721.1 MAG: hypothetical protein A3H40_03150 [Candidatus Daviesbacteria bacterium RIFCSPLOWO2_02_FULL_38_15]